MKTLEEKIGYSFRDRSLLENALTHSSYANEHRAAVYLDGGIGQVRKLIHRLVLDQEQEKTAAGRDYKTALQELVQRENGQVLSYRLTGESGPDHAKVFAMEVLLNDGVIGSGQGRSKKEAEQAAAKAAVLTLEGEAP